MRKVKQGEKVARLTQVVGDSAIAVRRTTEHKKYGIILSDWVFDFGGVSHAEIMALATRPLVITTQAQLRAAESPEQVEEYDNRTISVRDFLDRERAKVPPEEKARRAMGSLSPAARAKLIEELLAEGEEK